MLKKREMGCAVENCEEIAKKENIPQKEKMLLSSLPSDNSLFFLQCQDALTLSLALLRSEGKTINIFES